MKQFSGITLCGSAASVLISLQFLVLLLPSLGNSYSDDKGEWNLFSSGDDFESHETLRTTFDDDEGDSNFEGDIDLEHDQQMMFEANDEPVESVYEMLREKYRWPKNRLGYVEIPFTFEHNKFSEFYVIFVLFAQIKISISSFTPEADNRECNDGY